MQKRMQILNGLLALSLLVALSPLSTYAAKPEKGMHPAEQSEMQSVDSDKEKCPSCEKHEEHFKESLQKAGLNATQMQQAEKIHQTTQETIKPLRSQLHDKYQALTDYLSSPNAEMTRAKSFQSDIVDTQQKMGQLWLDEMFKLRSVMKPEQFKEFLAFKKTMMEKHHEMMQQHHTGGMKQHHSGSAEQQPSSEMEASPPAGEPEPGNQ